MKWIKIWQIDPIDPTELRNYEHYKNAIRNDGTIGVIIVTEYAPDKYKLIAGAPKVFAARAVGMFTIPVTVFGLSGEPGYNQLAWPHTNNPCGEIPL